MGRRRSTSREVQLHTMVDYDQPGRKLPALEMEVPMRNHGRSTAIPEVDPLEGCASPGKGS